MVYSITQYLNNACLVIQKLVEHQPGDETGIKDVVIEVSGFISFNYYLSILLIAFFIYN